LTSVPSVMNPSDPDAMRSLLSPACVGPRFGRTSFLTVSTIAAAIFAASAFSATEAKADLRICNKTSSRIGIAVGYKDQTAWATEGWWNLPASSCETLLAGPLVSRYYYIYAIDYDRGGEWSGRSFMCTQEKTFTIRGIEDCLKRGFERTGFFEIDTGEQRSWTVQLTEPGRAGLGTAGSQ